VDSRNLEGLTSIETHLLKRVRKISSLNLNTKELEPKWTTLISMPIKKRKRCKLMNSPICKTFSKEKQTSISKMSIWIKICQERTTLLRKLEVTRKIRRRMLPKMKLWRCSERLKRWTLIPQSRSNNKTF
jgi:hypothetical protein